MISVSSDCLEAVDGHGGAVNILMQLWPCTLQTQSVSWWDLMFSMISEEAQLISPFQKLRLTPALFPPSFYLMCIPVRLQYSQFCRNLQRLHEYADVKPNKCYIWEIFQLIEHKQMRQTFDLSHSCIDSVWFPAWGLWPMEASSVFFVLELPKRVCRAVLWPLSSEHWSFRSVYPYSTGFRRPQILEIFI